MKKVCFITAIYGNYEKSCKKYAPQTAENTDFICFTDNPNIISNGWIIDTIPYHIIAPSPLDNSTYTNSMTNNQHSFNIAKYYKQAFLNIDRLKQYDVVVWLDGTIEIHNPDTAEWIIHNIKTHRIIGWEHEHRRGKLQYEMDDSRDFYRYSSTFWNNQSQPFQDVKKQYNDYLELGYDDEQFYSAISSRPNLGVWVTCFVAFSVQDPGVANFLDIWYLQTLKYTTQDQIGFPFCVQNLGIIPYTLPDEEIKGKCPHSFTDFYIKHSHGI